MDKTFGWLSIFSTCHHIHKIMRTATELWWKVDCAQPRIARIVFLRSEKSPQAMIIRLNLWDSDSQRVVDHWKKKRALNGYRLHTLELYGTPLDIPRFSWIFERPLPRLRYLRIYFSRPLDDEGNELPTSNSATSRLPVALQLPTTLQLPTNIPLRVLNLCNTTLPWSSNLFIGLRKLHLDFTGCDDAVEISVDELFRILDASPQLESLSLMQLGLRKPIGNNTRQPNYVQIVQFPNLTFLGLENSPEVIGLIMIHIDIPAITCLRIRSLVVPQNVAWSLDLLVPGVRLQTRLFSNPPIFQVTSADTDEPPDFMLVDIGSFKIWLDFDWADA